MAVISDTFTNTNNTSLDAHSGGGFSWTEYNNGDQDFDIFNNQVRLNASTTAAQSVARANADLGSADMYAQIELGAYTPISFKNQFIGVAVRFDSASETCYYAMLGTTGGDNDKYIRIGKVVSGTYTTLASVLYEWTTGDVIRLEVSGNTLTAYVNDSQEWQGTDNSISTGTRAGIATMVSHFGSNMLADNFEAGSLGGDEAESTIKVFTGSGFEDKPYKRFDGTNWIDISINKF